jgi:deazaflavin-dependent oxidoreductase (nitroreductase family)
MGAPGWHAEEFCYVTSRGRRSGNPHEIEIWFGASPSRPDRIYLLSGGGNRSDWVRNMLANPAVRVRIGERQWEGSAGSISDAAEDLHARHLLAAKYQGWHQGQPMSGWAETALPIAIDLSSS